MIPPLAWVDIEHVLSEQEGVSAGVGHAPVFISANAKSLPSCDAHDTPTVDVIGFLTRTTTSVKPGALQQVACG